MAETGNTIQQFNIKATADVQSAIRSLESLKASMQSVDKGMSMAGATRSLKQFEGELSTMARDIKSRAQEMAKSMSPAELRQAINQNRRTMNSAQSQMTAYGDNMGQMWRNAKTDFTKADTQFQVYQNRLDELSKSSGTIQTKFEGVFDSDKLKGEIFGGGKEMLIDMGSRDYASEIDEFISKAQYVSPTIEKTTTALGTLKFWTRKAFQPQSLQKFANKMSVVSEKTGAISDKMGKVGGFIGNLGKKFLSAINPMRLFNKEQSKTALASSFLGKAFSRLARMFRIMVTRMLIRAFITNIREGFQNIAQYSEEVNRAFSRIGASAKTLYNSVASAFAPLIQAIAPYIVKALDMITSAFNKVAELISAITGKSYYIKATKYNYDYAKSLDKSTKSTNKNTKATNKNKKAKKDLKNETIGIDRLNVIAPDKDKNANSGNGSGNGNGNNGANVNDMFDTKPVSKKMKDLAKEIKKVAKKLFEPIQEAWNKKGAKVLGSFKSMLGSIWETVKAIGRDFLTMWAQPQTEIIFEDILDTVATIFDIVTAISDQFRKAWNKDNVGLHIFENLRDVVGIVVKRIKKCAEYTRDWAKHLNFSPMLQSIERYTKSLKKLVKGLSDIAGDFYETVVLGISKWVVEKGLPNLIQVFTDFNNKVNWQALRKAIKVLWDGIEKLTESIGDGLIIVLDNLMDAFADLLNSKWFQGLIKAIGNLMKSIKPQYIEWFIKAWLGMKAIKFASGLFGKIALKLGTIIKYARLFKYSSVGGKIVSAFSGIGGKIKGVFAGLGGTLKSSASSVGASAGTTMATSMASTLSTVFAPLVVAGLGVALTLIYDKIRKSAFETGLLNEEEQKYLNKLDEANQKWQDTFNRQKETNQNLLTAKDNASFYKDELGKIVDKNGKIKKGYEIQAQFLVDKLNPYLDDDLSIVGNTVKGWKKQNKQIEKQIALITAKNTLEQNGQSYYDAKGGIGKSISELKNATGLSNKAWDKLMKAGGLGSAQWRSFSFKDNKAYQQSQKALKKLQGTYQQIIRYDNLRRAVATGNNKKIEQANKMMNKGLTKYEKQHLAELFNRSQTTGEDLLTLIENDSKLADKTYSGSFSNIAKNGKKAFGKVKKSVDSVPNNKTTKLKTNGLGKFNKDVDSAGKKVKSSIPSTVTVEVKARLSITNFKTVSNATKKISNAVKKGGKVIKVVSGGDRHKYAIVETAGGKRKKIRTMASGGFPKLGSEFIAGEKGAEMVGTINGKTGVASNMEITGIRDSIEETSSVQNQLLIEQNNLLRGILAKNTDIVLDGEKVTKKVNKINARKGYRMAT